MSGWIPEKNYVKIYIKYIIRWILLAILIGVPCGVLGALFYNGVAFVTSARQNHPYLLFMMPVAGLLIVLIYKALKIEGVGTDAIVRSAQEGTFLRLRVVPAIFISTLLTHLTGGSSGREGAALQIGGSIGNNIGKMTRLRKEDLKIATMAGMASFFTALFGTPITATVFVAFFLEVGQVYTSAFFPSYAASVVAFFISKELGMKPFRFALTGAPSGSVHMFFRVAILALLGALVSAVFVKTLHSVAFLYRRFFKNAYVRILVGSALVILLTLLVGNTDYNGAGTDVITRAIMEGKASPAAFLLKILFTALTLEAGFKGGEIVPSFFIGATFGAAVGPLLGIPAQFAAAIGLVVVFGGATNSLVAPLMLSIESFGSGGVEYFMAAVIIAYMCSGYNGLYSNQKILFSKLRAHVINLNTNNRPEVTDEVLEKETGHEKL